MKNSFYGVSGLFTATVDFTVSFGQLFVGCLHVVREWETLGDVRWQQTYQINLLFLEM